MNITGIDSVIYGVEDIETGRRFWQDFGLSKLGESDGLTFATAENSTIVLHPAGKSGLPPAPVAGSTVREVIWGVDSAAALEAIAAELQNDAGFSRDRDGTVHCFDPAGYGIAFRQSRVRPAPSPANTAYNTPGAAARIDRPGALYSQAAPQHLAHVVFLTPEILASLEFYRHRLGFKLTDSYPGRGYFLRAGGSSDHHNLFLLKRDDAIGFHHIAFDVRDIHEVFGGGLNMTAKGWETHLGPGRHPISSAYFWYFRNPCGGAAEYDSDSDVVTDAWQAREFEPTPDAFAEWALADGIERYTGIQKT